MSETHVAYTKPLSRMQCLSESHGGGGSKVTKPIFSNSAPGGGGYSGFHVLGMIEWSQKSRPKKNPYGFQQNPKNPWTKN